MRYDLCILCILWHDYAWETYCGDSTRRNTSEFTLFYHLACVQHFSSWCPEAFCHEKRCDSFWEVYQENSLTNRPQMWLAKLTDRLWGSTLLLGWLLPKHLLHYLPTSAFQHPPVALVHLFPFSSVPAPEACGKKYIERIKVDQLGVLRAGKARILCYFVWAVWRSKLKAVTHSSWDNLAQASPSDVWPPWGAPPEVDGTQLHHLKELLWGQGGRGIWRNCTANFGWKEKSLPGKEIVDFNSWQQHSNVPSSFVFSATVINCLLGKILDHE